MAMDEVYSAWQRKQLLAAALQGLAGYLKASSSRSHQVRRLRFLFLVWPLVTQLTVRLSMRHTKGPAGEVSGSMSLIPLYLLMLGAAAYSAYVYISSRKRPP